LRQKHFLRTGWSEPAVTRQDRPKRDYDRRRRLPSRRESPGRTAGAGGGSREPDTPGRLGLACHAVALAEQLDLLHLLEGLAESRFGVFELAFQVVGRALEVVAPLHRRLGVGRIGEMTGIVNPGAILLDLDVALEIAADALELADHAFDLGDPAAPLLDLKLLQANECFA